MKQLRIEINQAKKDFPGCKVCGPVKFSTFNRYYVRDNDSNLLRTLEDAR